jgi:UTP--glucose-1-phosphate uridylyltransferase
LTFFGLEVSIVLRMKALIPAAGLGTRWYPWTHVVPKELLPVGRRPAIHIVLDEAVAAGIGDIGIVIRYGKELIRIYVEQIWQPSRAGVKLTWLFQARPSGVGDALLAAKDWVGGEPVAVLYPDELHPTSGGLARLRPAFEARHALWLGLAPRYPSRRQTRFSVQRTDGEMVRIFGICKKETAGNVAYGTGRYILPRGLMDINGTAQNLLIEREEIGDDQILECLWRQDTFGLELPGPIYDIGSPENWLVAKADFRPCKQLQE